MIGLIRALLEALTAYVRHRTETDLLRRIADSRRELSELAEAIDDLRAAGDAGATQRADRLRAEAEIEREHLEHLRARLAAAEPRAGDRDA